MEDVLLNISNKREERNLARSFLSYILFLFESIICSLYELKKFEIIFIYINKVKSKNKSNEF